MRVLGEAAGKKPPHLDSLDGQLRDEINSKQHKRIAMSYGTARRASPRLLNCEIVHLGGNAS